jgi:hypothetical protein
VRYWTIRIPRCDGYKTIAFNLFALIASACALAWYVSTGDSASVLWCWLLVGMAAANLSLRLATNGPALAPAADPHRVGPNRVYSDYYEDPSTISPIFSQKFSEKNYSGDDYANDKKFSEKNYSGDDYANDKKFSEKNSSVYNHLSYKIYNSSPADVAIDTDDEEKDLERKFFSGAPETLTPEQQKLADDIADRYWQAKAAQNTGTFEQLAAAQQPFTFPESRNSMPKTGVQAKRGHIGEASGSDRLQDGIAKRGHLRADELPDMDDEPSRHDN